MPLTGLDSRVEVSDTSVTMDHLAPATQYTFRVSATNDVGSGRYSANATVTSAAIVPDIPIGLTATPRHQLYYAHLGCST